MGSQTSLESVVSRLEAQIAFDKEREAFHAEQETFHREKRAAFAAEIEKLTGVLEAFKTAAATAAELETRAAAVTPPKPTLDIGRKATLTAMIRLAL